MRNLLTMEKIIFNSRRKIENEPRERKRERERVKIIGEKNLVDWF